MEDLEDNSKRFQSSPLKNEVDEENYEEFEQDFEEAFENTDSLKASSNSMTYSVSKTGGFENFELPPPRYEAIQENFEENEESKFQQPTQAELDLQKQRLRKAKDALIKIKKEEIAKKGKGKNQKLITTEKSVKKTITKPSVSEKKIVAKPSVPEKKIANQKKKSEPIEETSFGGFQVEKAAKATNSEAPGANFPAKLAIPPLKLVQSVSGESTKAKKREEEAKQLEDHKSNMENLKGIFNQKKAKAEQNLKNMENIQKQLLEKEKLYKVPTKEPAKAKTIPQAPPAPRPRALNESCYKLHQLAETSGSKETRLAADKLSGSMLQAIKILSIKISEEFPYPEILEESKRIEQAEKGLAVGKDMKRGEVDYHEETRKKLGIYQGLIGENLELVKQKIEMLKGQEELIEKIKKLEPLKAVVKIGEGKYIRAGCLPDGLVDTMEELDSVGSEVMKEHPVDVVIEKIEKQGSTLKQLFTQIDGDGDKILTITEIRLGLAGIQVKLTDEDKDLLLKTLDTNSDGVVSEEEFFKILDPKLRNQQEYRALVGNLDVNNPIIFEERILDMKLKGKMLYKEIPKMVSRLKSKIETENKLLGRIKHLEKILQDREIKNISGGDLGKKYEEQIKEAEAKKLKVFKESMQEKSTSAFNLNEMQEKVKQTGMERAVIAAEAENNKSLVANLKLRQEALQSKEKKLDEANRIIAIVMIQSRVKRYLARIRYQQEKTKVEKALNVIVPVLRKNVVMQKERRENAKLEITPIVNKKVLEKEEKKEVVEISEVHSDRSSQSQALYFCVTCEKKADRLCLTCLSKYCSKCFAPCRVQLHSFGLVDSESRRLNLAEEEFINVIKQSHMLIPTLLTSESSQNSTLSYMSLRKLLIDYRPSFDKSLIQNMLMLATKYLKDENIVDIASLSALFS